LNKKLFFKLYITANNELHIIEKNKKILDHKTTMRII